MSGTERNPGVPTSGQSAGDRPAEAAPRGDEMGGAPYPSDMTMPDARHADHGGNFEGETDPGVRSREGEDRSDATRTGNPPR